MKKYITSEIAELFEPNVYINFVVTLKGNISKNELADAIKNAFNNNESTMSKIVMEPSGKAYYEKMPETECKIFFDNRDWREIVSESEKKPFEINKGELIRAFIIDNTDSLILLIQAHHLVGDGMSIVCFLNDIFDSLDGKTLDYKPLVLINNEYLEDKIKLKFYIRRFIKKINRLWEKSGREISWDDYYAVHNAYWKKNTSYFEFEQYDVKKIKSECSGIATINSYIIAKFLKDNPSLSTIGIPISVRENNKSMSNQTSGITVNYKYNTNKSFEYNLRKLHSNIRKVLDNNYLKYFVLSFETKVNPAIVSGLIMQKYGVYDSKLTKELMPLMGYSGKRYSDIGVTNLKNIEVKEKYNNFSVEDILFIPPKVSYSERVVGISTFRNKLTVCKHKIKNM